MPPTPVSATSVSATSSAGSTATSSGKSKNKFVSLLLLLILLAGPAYFTLSFNKPKFARSEISYAEQSREMILNKNWITPYYHYMPCIDKPAMIYWMIIPAFKTFGQEPFPARVPAIIAALATLSILAFALRKAFDWQTALFGSLILATSSRFVEFATLCMTDIFLTLFDLVTMVSLYAVTRTEKNQRMLWYSLAALSAGLATLTKGPVGLVLPGACFVSYLVITKQLRVLFNRYTLIAAILFFAVAAPWYVAVAFQIAGPKYFLAWLWQHNVERFVGSTYAYHYPWYYMIESFFLGFAPWSVLIPCAAAGTISNWRKKKNMEQAKAELYMWLWIGLTTLFFTVSKGKMNYYDLPAFPAGAGLVAIYTKRWLDAGAKTTTVFGWMFAASFVILGAGSCLIVPHITGGSPGKWFLIPASLFAGGAVVIAQMVRKQQMKAWASIGVTLLLTITAFSVEVMHAISSQIPALDYLTRLRNEHRPFRFAMHDAFAITVDWVDHGVFYTGKVPDLISNNEQLTKFLTQPSLAYVIVPRDKFDELPESVRDSVQVLDERPYISDKLALPFILKRHGDLCGTVPLLLVANQRVAQP